MHGLTPTSNMWAGGGGERQRGRAYECSDQKMICAGDRQVRSAAVLSAA